MINLPDRPGISSATLEANGVHCVETRAEMAPYRFKYAGIVIPYRNYGSLEPITDMGGIYARLRLKVPQGKKKYHQNFLTNVHVYIPVGLAELVVNGCRALVIVEGEFKAMSLVEAGIPAVGMSGFYGFRYGNEHELAGKMLPELVDALEYIQPKEMLFLGDNDTALNFQFADAAVIFAQLIPKMPVMLPRIPLSEPKGIDDVRHSRNGTFQAFWDDIVKNAVPVNSKTNRAELAETLLRRELDNIRSASLPLQSEYLTKLVKMASFYKKDVRQRFVNVAIEIGITEEHFMAMIREQWSQKKTIEEDVRKAKKLNISDLLMRRSLLANEAQQPAAPATTETSDGKEKLNSTITTPNTNELVADEPDSTAKPFPLECLPPAFSRMAKELCRCILVPESLTASCMLGFMSASIGKGLQIQSLPHRKTPANLYLMISAASGTGKSLVFNRVAEPFQFIEKTFIENWRKQTKPRLMIRKNLVASTIENRNKQILKGAFEGAELEKVNQEVLDLTVELNALETQTKEPTFSVEDVTTEKLGMLLGENDECLASLSSDAGANVNNILGRYNKLDRTDENLYLKAFSWDSAKVDRVGRDAVHLDKPCLTMLWLVQPDKVDTILGEPSLTEGGLIPRMMICHSGCQPQEMPECTPTINPEVATAYDASVYSLFNNYRLRETPVIIKPTQEVTQYLRDHFNRLVKRRRTDLRDISTFAARWTEWVWRIGACLHAATHMEDAPNHMFSLETATNAVAISDWFAERVMDMLSSSRFEKEQALMERLSGLLASNPSGISARDVQRAHIADLADEAAQLLIRLEAEGILVGRECKPPNGGHTTRRYTMIVKGKK